MSITGKVLIVVSDAASFTLQHKDGTTSEEDTGIFMQELTKPLAKLLAAGYSVTFASPQGKGPTIDPFSQSTFGAYLGNWFAKHRDQKLIAEMKADNDFDDPRPLASLTEEELATFSGIFIPGGHAPLTDLGDNPDLGRILWHFHQNDKPTASLCHGPFALLSTKYALGSAGFAYEGYRITSSSDAEEGFVEMMKDGTIPTTVESTLASEDVEMVTGMGQMVGSITVDRELITGSNPMAARGLGQRFVQMLMDEPVRE